MNKKIQEKIEKLESKVKEMHFVTIWHADDEMFKLFWVLHVKPVIDHCKELAEKHKANLQIVWLAAILHDIARLYGEEPHDEKGAKKAYKMLMGKGFGGKLAEKVRDTIFTHRCKEHKPKTIEQKILTTADAVNHFKAPFFIWHASTRKIPFKEQLKSYLEKLNRDWNDKIFFETEKESVRQEYEVLRRWFEFHSKIN